MKRALFLILLLSIGQLGLAQNKILTLEDAILKGRSTLGPERMNQLKWIPGTESFSYVEDVDEEPILLKGTASSKSRDVLASLSDINTALKAAGVEERTRFPRYQYIDASSFRFLHKHKIFRYQFDNKSLEEISEYSKDALNMDLSKQHQMAYTIAQNLFISLPGKPNLEVTNEKDEYIRNGEPTHRYEFGIMQGTFWAPQGDRLAYYHVNEKMVSLYPLLSLKEKPAGYTVISYPFAGEPSHHAQVAVYNLKSKKTIYLETGGDPEHYLTNIAWSPDGKSIFVAEINRDQNKMDFNRYNAKTGKKEATLFTEEQEKYVHPTHTMKFVPGQPDKFIWQSERDGFNHLYLYNTKGELLSQLTKGDWLVTSLLGFDKNSKNIFVQGTTNYGLERHLRKVSLKNGKTTTYNAEQKGTHSIKMSDDAESYIDTWTSTTVPRRVSVRSSKDGSLLQELLNSKNPLQDYNLGETSLFQIKAADKKTDLWCRMITPPNMDAKKKYPVLVYVYNGPGVQLITDRWGAGCPLWMQVAAQSGMIVFTVDGRGSSNRGIDFEQSVFRDLGTQEIADQLAGVDYLKSLAYVDQDRMAVHGWSYGGFMTTSLMSRAPGTFKVGVAGGPVIDWSLYEVMYTERYMDTPEQNPEGYKRSNLLNHIENLEGKLLLIHGTSDDVVVWQHSLNYVEQCVKKGVQLDYFPYPNHPHNVRGKDRIHLMRKVLDYITDNLD